MGKILIVIVLVLSVCCTEKRHFPSYDFVQIKVNAGNKNGGKVMSEVENYELIPLSYQGRESLVTTVLKYEVSDDLIILLCQDSRVNKAILVFDRSGEFKRRIETIETDQLIESNVEDFVIGESGLIVLDRNSNLIQLDSDFKPQSVKRLAFKAVSVSLNSGKILAYANGQAKNLQPDSLLNDLFVLNVNRDFELEGRFKKLEIEEYSQRILSRMYGNIQPYGRGFLFSQFLNDTIYSIEDGKMVGKYLVDFEKKAFDQSKFPSATVQPFSPILTDGFRWGISYTIDIEDYLFFQFFDGDVPKGAKFNKATNNITIYNPYDLVIDDDLIPWPKHYSNGYFFGMITEQDLIGIPSGIKYEDNSIMDLVTEHINTNSNPVLFKFKMKL